MQILPITVFLSMQLFKYPEWKLSFFFPPLPFFFFFSPVWSWGASAPQEYKRLGWVSFFFFFLLPFSSVSLWLIQTPGIYLFFLRDLGMFASSAVFHFISKGKGELKKKKTTHKQQTFSTVVQISPTTRTLAQELSKEDWIEEKIACLLTEPNGSVRVALV